jgi:hypothetical protein
MSLAEPTEQADPLTERELVVCQEHRDLLQEEPISVIVRAATHRAVVQTIQVAEEQAQVLMDNQQPALVRQAEQVAQVYNQL